MRRRPSRVSLLISGGNPRRLIHRGALRSLMFTNITTSGSVNHVKIWPGPKADRHPIAVTCSECLVSTLVVQERTPLHEVNTVLTTLSMTGSVSEAPVD